MNNLMRNILLGFAVVFVYVTVTNGAEISSLSKGSSDIQIELNDGALWLEAHNATLHEVISEIGDLAGFKTIVVGDIDETTIAELLFENIPVREAIERLINDKNRAIFYASAREEAEHDMITQVWLLGSGAVSDDDLLSDDKAIASGRKESVKGHKLIRLTKMLQESQEKQVRTRAVIALGALQDERAVLALESALLDQDSSVRLQAISSLGRIGNEQAIIALGNTLLNGSADITERVMAAQALWTQNSETAQAYLDSGAYDNNKQVRLASSKPSSSSKVPTKNDQLRNAGAQ